MASFLSRLYDDHYDWLWLVVLHVNFIQFNRAIRFRRQTTDRRQLEIAGITAYLVGHRSHLFLHLAQRGQDWVGEARAAHCSRDDEPVDAKSLKVHKTERCGGKRVINVIVICGYLQIMSPEWRWLVSVMSRRSECDSSAPALMNLLPLPLLVLSSLWRGELATLVLLRRWCLSHLFCALAGIEFRLNALILI